MRVEEFEQEQELESFLIDRNTKNKRSASRDKKQLNSGSKSGHIFKVAIAVPVLAALTVIFLFDRHSQQKNAAIAEQAIADTPVSTATSASARLNRLNPVLSIGKANKEPSLKDLQAMSTSALASQLQSTSSDTIKKNVLSRTGKQISDAQIEKARSGASSSAVINKLDSARQSYSGSSSDAIDKIRSKLNN